MRTIIQYGLKTESGFLSFSISYAIYIQLTQATQTDRPLLFVIHVVYIVILLHQSFLEGFQNPENLQNPNNKLYPLTSFKLILLKTTAPPLWNVNLAILDFLANPLLTYFY